MVFKIFGNLVLELENIFYLEKISAQSKKSKTSTLATSFSASFSLVF